MHAADCLSCTSYVYLHIQQNQLSCDTEIGGTGGGGGGAETIVR